MGSQQQQPRQLRLRLARMSTLHSMPVLKGSNWQDAGRTRRQLPSPLSTTRCQPLAALAQGSAWQLLWLTTTRCTTAHPQTHNHTLSPPVTILAWRKRLRAMSTQIMDSSSGSMKLRALAMAMNTSSFTRSGTPCGVGGGRVQLWVGKHSSRGQARPDR